MLFGIDKLDVYLVLGILILFGLLEVMAGHLQRSKRTRGDWIQEVGGFFALSVLIKPLIVLAVMGLGHAVFPQYSNSNPFVTAPIMAPNLSLFCLR